MNRQLNIQFCLSCIMIGAFTYLNFFGYPYSLGGSLVLCVLIAAFVPLTLKIQKLSSEFCIIQSIIIFIIVINFLSYWELSGKALNVPYLIIFYGCLVWIITQYLTIFEFLFKSLGQINEADQRLVKQIRQTLRTPVLFIGLQFTFFSGLMVYFIRKVEPQIYYSVPLLKLSYVAVALFILFFFIAFIYLSKMKDEDIKRLFTSAEDKYILRVYDLHRVKQYTLFTFVFITVVGSAIELQRGMWVMWIETILLLGLMSLIIWKIYKHVFVSK